MKDSSSTLLPAEWETHKATWLTWPYDDAHWPGRFASIPRIWAELAKVLEENEEVNILVHNEEVKQSAEVSLKEAGAIGKQINFFEIPNNFSWMRDHGPIFVKRHNATWITHWTFNAWGEKWEFNLDRQIPEHVAKAISCPYQRIDAVLEGGAIDTNGKGILITTESCLLNKNRNPSFSYKQIDQLLKQTFGLKNIIWLYSGLVDDETDGHVDNVCRFANESTILIASERNVFDPNYEICKTNRERITSFIDNENQRFEVVELPLPKPIYCEGIRLPASYNNFYIANEVVIVPIFHDAQDEKAVSIFERIFPTRKIIPMDSLDLLWGYGSFHCITQQQPL